MAPGRRDGAGCREGAKGSPKHCHAAATSWGEDTNTHQSCCVPAAFCWLGLAKQPGKQRLLTL